MSAEPSPLPSSFANRLARRVAVVSGVFCAVVALLLAVSAVVRIGSAPDDLAAVDELQRALTARGDKERMRQDIRRLDALVRAQQFARQRFQNVGIVLLGIGGGVCMLATGAAVVTSRRPAMPSRQGGGDVVAQHQSARWAVGAAAAVLAAAAVALALIATSGPPSPAAVPAELDSPLVGASPVYPSTGDIEANWPMFRGPAGRGVAQRASVPDDWDGPTGRNILWKTPVPLAGRSSPVVWGQHVFVTGGDEKHRAVFAFDLASGKPLWRYDVRVAPPSARAEVMEDTGYAAPTPVADGQRVYAMFPTGELVCLDFQGRRVWSRYLGPLDNVYGHAASLVQWRDLLLVPLDQGEDAQAGKSRLIALDAHTGGDRWSIQRPVGASWTTPIVVQSGPAAQVITAAAPLAIAYSAADGKELWRVDGLAKDTAPSPAFGAGVAVVGQAGGQLLGIRVDGSGDVTKTHINWTADSNVPDMPSPVATDECLFTVAADGTVICRRTATGEVLWEQEVAAVTASPLVVGERLYLLDRGGNMHILRAGPKFEKLGLCKLGEPSEMTPAIVDGRIIIRGEHNLYCIGARP